VVAGSRRVRLLLRAAADASHTIQPMTDGTGATPGGAGGGERSGLVPGGLPSRAAYVLAFLSVIVAGALGGVIGYGLADLGTEGDSALANVAGLVVGALVGAVGVGVVAVLVLRAMAEWQRGGKRAR
jgi:hypothetical protein